MRVGGVGVRGDGEWAEVVASVVWEDVDRPDLDVFFRVPESASGSLLATPDALLGPCLLTAMEHGERRLVVDGEVCPFLLEGVTMAAATVRHWFGGTIPELQVETRARQRVVAERRTALMFSGGVDSMHALQSNRLSYRRDHPGWIRDGVVVQALARAKYNERAWQALRAIADDAELNLIPMETNLRDLDPRTAFWQQAFQGPVLTACVHVLGGTVSDVVLGATYDLPHLHPYGSHPMTDHLFSSFELRIRHVDFQLSRLEKTRRLAHWPVAVDNVNVCNYLKPLPAEVLNCGRCAKCLRTKLGFLVVGVLDRSEAFTDKELSPQLLRRGIEMTEDEWRFDHELVEPLRTSGYEQYADTLVRLRRIAVLEELARRRFGSIGTTATSLVSRGIRRLRRAFGGGRGRR